MGPIMPILPIWTLSKDARGLLVQADDWDEMARKLDLDAAVLKNTIQRFNANANAGHDPDFHRGEHTYDRIFGDHKIKSNPSLMPLEKPPFYALRIYPGDIGTNGGLVTDVNGAVIDKAGQPIPGLYATGNITASPMGRSYPGGGATLGPAMTFGYIAAQHATGTNEQGAAAQEPPVAIMASKSAT